MYLSATENHWAIDIETDDLNATIIWVMCAQNIKTKEELTLVGHERIKQFIDERPEAIYIGHNAVSFDVPTLNRLLGVRIPLKRVVDTFVLSMLYSPSLKGGHSLDAWGQRLNFHKGSFNDWSKYSEEMARYCLQDTRLCALLFRKLTDRMRRTGFSEMGCWIEHNAWHIIKKQQKNGFYLDVPKANMLVAELTAEADKIKERIYERFPAQLVVVKQFGNARKADGEFTANYERHLQAYPKLEIGEDGRYRAFDWVEFNLASPPQRIEKLLELGWKPKEFTKPSKTHPEGQPKVTDGGELVPSLAKFAEDSGIEEVALIAQHVAITGRLNAVKNWLDLADDNGLIHGNLWLASTLRYRHDKPNTANIPAVRVKNESPLLGRDGFWTYEARDLWTTRDRENRRLVGVDAKGIQLRVLAHYLDDPDFTAAILSEDPHSVNQQRLGLSSRALTKTITYATLMGAGDKRIAAEAGVSLKEAKEAKAKFFAQIPGLPKLINKLQWELKKTGRITLCDGSRVLVSSDHMVIPYLLQGDESRIMKLAAIYVDAEIRKRKLDVLKVGDIHDEWQSDVLAVHIPDFTSVCDDCFRRSGEFFHYRLPIECDAKVGLTWAETH